MLAPPLAFAISLGGLCQDRSKGYAIAGLIVSGLIGALVWLPVLL